MIITHQEGMFRFMLYVVYAAAAGHAERLGATGDTPQVECRARAQAAVDTHDGDLTAARRRGEAMTLDDLATYALETLGTS